MIFKTTWTYYLVIDFPAGYYEGVLVGRFQRVNKNTQMWACAYVLIL